MKQAITNLIERLLEGSAWSREELFWAALFVGLVFASLHLTSMLITRWGDSRTSSKALICSVLVHVSCALGLVAVNPPPSIAAKVVEEDQIIPLERIFVEGEEKFESMHPGNTPIWHRAPEPIVNKLSRLDRSLQEPKPLTVPERHNEPLSRPDLNIPELPHREEIASVPKPEQSSISGTLEQAVAPLKIDDDTAESRPEVEIPSSSKTRMRVARIDRTDTETPRKAKRGSVDRLRVDPDLSQKHTSVTAPRDLSSLLRKGPEDDLIDSRSGLTPSPILDDDAGTNTANSGRKGKDGAPVPPRISRRRTRTRDSNNNGTLEPFRRRRTPKSPQAKPNGRLALRKSIAVDGVRNGPRPSVKRREFDTELIGRDNSVPPTYQLRNLQKRKTNALKSGGTDESERAVEASLRWLANQQNVEGYWNAKAFGAGRVKTDAEGKDDRGVIVKDGVPGVRADTGLTALAVLAFLGAGYTHEDGQYADVVDRALQWLVRNQREDGYLGGKATYYARMYCHAMTTYALAEAYGMQSDPTLETGLRKPLTRAVNYILANQNPDGGWRYRKGQLSDMSIFGWQLMALKSADIAGIGLPKKSKQQMVQFLKVRSLGKNKGLAGYAVNLETKERMPPSSTMTAEALFCKQMLGIKRSSSASTEAVEYLMQRLPRRSKTNLYYWYYGTLAMYQYGGKPWREWNEAVRDQLVTSQRTTGEQAGSWDAIGPWGPYGGRVYSTALSTLCLEVYYRFLPLYNMGGRYEDK